MMRVGRHRWRRGKGVGFAIAAIVALVVPCAAVLFVAAAAGAAATGVPPRVVPGESIGPARLGMTAVAAAAALGPSVARGPNRRVYSKYGLVLDFDSGVVVRIATTSVKYRTIAGAGVGTAAAETPGLVGDVNSVTTRSGQDMTVLYAFQGVGFVFRAGRAVETFVVAAIPFGPPKNSSIVPVSPGGPPIMVPGGLPAPPGGGSGGTAQPPLTPGSPAAALRDVTANVESVGGITVTGTVANTGAVPIGSLTVTAAFTRASGDQVDGKTTISGPLAPGQSVPFTIHAAMVADIIIRYQVSVTGPTGAVLATAPAQAVPVSAYAAFAQRQVHVKADLGAPSTAVGPQAVQVLVSVADTGVIPPQWVRQITVVLQFTDPRTAMTGSTTVQLRPGQTQTVMIPTGATLAAPQVTGVVLSGQ